MAIEIGSLRTLAKRGGKQRIYEIIAELYFGQHAHGDHRAQAVVVGMATMFTTGEVLAEGVSEFCAA